MIRFTLVASMAALLLSALLLSPAQAADPTCAGLPDSGLSSRDTVIGPGTSPYLGVWWGKWRDASNTAPTFLIVRGVSGQNVDATYILQGVVQEGNDAWKLESVGHIGADWVPAQTAIIFNVNGAGDTLSGTRYYQDKPSSTIVLSRCKTL